MVLEALDASNRPRGLSRQRSCAPRLLPGAAGRDRVTSSAEPWNTRVRGPDPESAFPQGGSDAQDEERSAGKGQDTSRGASPGAPGRLHRPGDADQAGALERPG